MYFYKKREDISIVWYIIFFTLFIYVVSNFINYDKFTLWFVDKDKFDIQGFVAFAFASYFLWLAVFSLVSHKYILKLISYFIIIASGMSTYFIDKYNVAIDRSMLLNIAYTNQSESLTLLSWNMVYYTFFLIIIPIYIVANTNIKYDKFFIHISKTVALFIVSFGITLAIIYTNFNSIHKSANKSNKYILYQQVPANYIGAGINIVRHYINDNFKTKQKPIEIKGKLTSNDDLVVVLALGETSRQKNFSLYGYNKKTNPLLSKIENLHVLNGIAKYGSTIWAIPQVLSRDDIKLSTVADTLGIASSCYVNFQLYGNCGTVPEIKVSNCKYEKCYDEDVLPLFEKDLTTYKSGKKFVVLHFGGGSHGPIYQNRYPKPFEKFKPICEYADIINNCTKDELYNSFDNTILYVDYVVSSAIETLEKSGVPYVFVYLSDHGESLLEGGRIFHGMPPGIDLPPEQAQIPLLIKSSVSIEISKKSEYKQQELYDTILSLLSIDTKILRKDKVFIKINKK